MRAKTTPLPGQLFDLQEALKELVDELPSGDARGIRISDAQSDSLVRAPRHELLFCVRSLFTYLIRHKSELEPLLLEWKRYADMVVILIALPERVPASRLAPNPAVAAEFELLLAEPVINDLMHRMAGSYVPDPPRRRFRLRFRAGERR